jgi:Tol biopolymer transport system component
LPGTEGGAMPFWSPDSSTVGFFALNKLKKVAIAGGAAQTLCDARESRGGSWSSGNVILFSAGAGHDLHHVSAEGGIPAAIPPDGINLERVQPSFLPDGRHFLYYGRSSRHGIFVGSLDSSEATMLVPNSSGAAFVPPGYLLSLEGASPNSAEMTILAQTFDPRTMQARGPRVALAGGVQFNSLLGLGAFSASSTGAVIYRVRPRRTTQLTWFDFDGRRLGTLGSPNMMTQPALSQDGRTVAVQRFDAGAQRLDLWSISVDRGVEQRLTTDGALNAMPIWSPDGKRIAFSSVRSAPPNLFEKDLVTGAEKRLVESTFVTHGTDWTLDGFLIYASLNPRMGFDIMKLPMTGREADRRPDPLIATEFNEHFGRVSPDGRWLAYMSDESGAREVYVQRFPGLGAKQRISTNGGTEPKWSRDGRTLFYFAPPDVLMAVPVTPGDSLQPGAPVPVFKMTLPPRNAREVPNEPTYTVSNNGLLMNTIADETLSAAATIVFNWPALLTPKNPTAR